MTSIQALPKQEINFGNTAKNTKTYRAKYIEMAAKANLKKTTSSLKHMPKPIGLNEQLNFVKHHLAKAIESASAHYDFMAYLGKIPK